MALAISASQALSALGRWSLGIHSSRFAEDGACSALTLTNPLKILNQRDSESKILNPKAKCENCTLKQNRAQPRLGELGADELTWLAHSPQQLLVAGLEYAAAHVSLCGLSDDFGRCRIGVNGASELICCDVVLHAQCDFRYVITSIRANDGCT